MPRWTAVDYMSTASFECANDRSIERLCLHDRSPAVVGALEGASEACQARNEGRSGAVANQVPLPHGPTSF